MLLLDLPDAIGKLKRAHGVFDDFYTYTTADQWATVASDSGQITVGDAANGILVIEASDATVADNDETYLKGTHEVFLLAQDKPIEAEAYIQFTDQGTPADDNNVIFGLLNAVAANHLQDNGAGPVASFSGACFFKVDGETVWRVRNSIGTTSKSSLTTVTAGGSAYQKLRMVYQPKNATVGDWMFWIDDVLVAKHVDQPFASATEMQLCLGIKTGAATNAGVLNVDYAYAYQLR